MTLVNGGALIGLFTLVGSGHAAFAMPLLWWSFAGFSVGLICTLSASLLAYLSQNYFYTACTYIVWRIDGVTAFDGSSPDPVAAGVKGNRCMHLATFFAALTIIGFIFAVAMALAAFTG